MRARADRPVRRSSDAGISLVEVLVAIVVIGTVMAAMAPFLVKSVMVVGQQRSQQVAVQVANDALERARALDPSSLLAGRGKSKTQEQWTAAPAAVATYLATMLQDWDPLLPELSDAGLQAPLPTVPNDVTVAGSPYSQSWYVGRCWQAKALTALAGACGTVPAASAVPFFRVVAAVTWSHRSCPAASCIYVASTLMSIGADPRFDLNRPPPVITDPGDQTGYQNVAQGPLQLVVSGGELPLTWTSTSLPPGLAVSAEGGLITGTPTLAGTYPVVIKATGQDGKADDTAFTWIIALVPTLTSPGAQRTTVGKTIPPLAIAAVGGLRPLKWAASGLPAGLTIDTSTGVITGAPTSVQTKTVAVTITDAGVPPRTASVTFNWQVFPPVALYNPGPQTVAIRTSIAPGAFSLGASGGLKPYQWRAENLPTGVSLNATTGAVSGTITGGSRFLTTVHVTDSLGDVDSMTVLVTVTASNPDIRVTTNPANPDRSTPRNVQPPALTVDAPGSNGSTTWTATNLPPNVVLSPSGVTSGIPTTPGVYVVTYTVTDNKARTAVLMFTWTVT